MSKSLRDAVIDRAAQLMERGWCRGALARDAKGDRADVYSAAAVEFCVAGSLLRATREVADETTVATDIVCAVIANLARLAMVNEKGTKAEAIAELRKFGEELSGKTA